MPRKSHKNKVYSAELKLQAVHDYLAHKGSQRELCRKYGIEHHSILQQWISCYNGHKDFKERSGARGEIYMTKGRKTTQEERAQIVAFCNKLQAAKMRQSMSRVGRCIDNGPMESFWGMLKSEMYYLKRFTDRDELILAIENYIHFYNNIRYQRRLRCMTPMEFHYAYAA